MEWSVSGASSVSIDSIKTVAVLGAGTMGNGIAHVFARSGYRVILRDVEQRFLDRGMETIGKNLDREIKKGKIAEAEKGTVLGLLRSEEHTSELQSHVNLVCRLLLEKKKK